MQNHDRSRKWIPENAVSCFYSIMRLLEGSMRCGEPVCSYGQSKRNAVLFHLCFYSCSLQFSKLRALIFRRWVWHKFSSQTLLPAKNTEPNRLVFWCARVTASQAATAWVLLLFHSSKRSNEQSYLSLSCAPWNIYCSRHKLVQIYLEGFLIPQTTSGTVVLFAVTYCCVMVYFSHYLQSLIAERN